MNFFIAFYKKGKQIYLILKIKQYWHYSKSKSTITLSLKSSKSIGISIWDCQFYWFKKNPKWFMYQIFNRNRLKEPSSPFCGWIPKSIYQETNNRGTIVCWMLVTLHALLLYVCGNIVWNNLQFECFLFNHSPHAIAWKCWYSNFYIQALYSRVWMAFPIYFTELVSVVYIHIYILQHV